MLCHDSTFCIYGPLWEKSIGHQCHKGRAWHIQKISLAPLPELCIFQSAHIEYKRKLCSNPLAQLFNFLHPRQSSNRICQVLKGPAMPSWDVSFVDSLNKLLNRQLSCQWFDTPWHSCERCPYDDIAGINGPVLPYLHNDFPYTVLFIDYFFHTYTTTFWFALYSYLLTISSILTQWLFDLPYTVIDCQTELTSPGTLLQGSNYSWYMLPWQQADIISLLFIQITLLI